MRAVYGMKARLALPPIALLIAVVVAFGSGQFAVSLPELWGYVMSLVVSGPSSEASATVETIIVEIRLPRILAAVSVGAALAVAGTAYQGMFRNPLVSPDILGVSAGAGLGAVVGIFLGLSMLWVQLLAFVGGLVAVALVYAVARLARHHGSTLAMALSGIAIGSLLGAGISLLKILADPYTELPSITFWLLGGLNAVTLADIATTVPIMLLGLVPLILLRWRMNVLSLSDEEATALGVNVVQTRLWFILSATLMTAAAVSITGIIGWIGLVIPHIARLWVGPNFTRLLPTALFMGAAFLVLTDTLARTLASIELPLGILTSFLGAPFFLSLLMKGGRHG